MLFDFLRKKNSVHRISEKQQEIPAPRPINQKENLSKSDIERILVSRVTTVDMLQFSMMPFDLDCPVHKYIAPNSHPFAFMNLNRTNQLVAKEELLKINEYILQAYSYIPSIRNRVCLHVGRVVFDEYSKSYGYTRLMCTPYTRTGKISKSPLSLSFMTRLDKKDYQSTGTLCYGVDGNVFKADVHVWKNANTPDLEGWSFYFKTVGRTFVLYEVKYSDVSDKYCRPQTIYKFDS